MENWEQNIAVKIRKLGTEHRCGRTENGEQKIVGLEEDNREQNIAVKNRELETEHCCGEKENREYNTDVQKKGTEKITPMWRNRELKNKTPLFGGTQKWNTIQLCRNKEQEHNSMREAGNRTPM